MSRSQFILGIALLVVSATLAFTITFKSENTPDRATEVMANNKPSKPNNVRQPYSKSRNLSPTRKDSTFYEVTVSDRALSTLAAAVQQDSRLELDALTERYQLTTSQRRGIFPHIAARHPQFQEGMIINGSTIPAGSVTSSLEDALYPLLDEDQQEALEDDALADNEWWAEIIGQLRDDLDQAISDGEMVPEVDPAPAPGNGETIENPDIDLENILGK